MNIDSDIFKIQSNNVLPSRGKILISEPFLRDATFGRSVVLLIDHTEEGSMGLIINKQLPIFVNDIIKEFKYIAQNAEGKSIADGRSYLPVDEHKGYIGTSNGIWIYDSDKMTIGKQIEGSGNPNADGYGELYYAQIGTMVRANDLVFAVHQQYGLLIIDPKTDKIIRTIAAPIEKETVKGQEKEIQRGFGSIVQSKDGTLWISMTQNTAGDGSALEYMLNLNPYTFKVDTVKIPLSETIGVVPNSWYAWTADGFCASAKENKIYWNGQPKEGSWFTGYQICGYDIDKKQFFQLIDLRKLDWAMT